VNPTAKKQKGLTWTPTNYVCPHEYILIKQEPELAKEILNSPVTEVYNGRVYHIIYRDGWKYWVIPPVINRKREEPPET